MNDEANPRAEARPEQPMRGPGGRLRAAAMQNNLVVEERDGRRVLIRRTAEQVVPRAQLQRQIQQVGDQIARVTEQMGNLEAERTQLEANRDTLQALYDSSDE